MGHKVLITGGSGYLGGTLLNRLKDSALPAYDTLFALVRTDSQREAVRAYGAEPLTFSVKDPDAVRAAVLENQITTVFFLIDAVSYQGQENFIQALAELKNKTGQDVHFLHTTGAKAFSSHTGTPTDKPLLDTDASLYQSQKDQTKGPFISPGTVPANCRLIDLGETSNVPVYIFAPCIVYGKGEGFGNVISIQTVAIIKAAKATRKVYKVDNDHPTWPVCHIFDNTSLYIQILHRILSNDPPPSGKSGFYLASSGSVKWEDIYATIAKAMHKRGLIDSEDVVLADEVAKKSISQALKCPPEMVPVQIGGNCTFTARRGLEIGWKPRYLPEHIFDALEDEVELVLNNI